MIRSDGSVILGMSGIEDENMDPRFGDVEKVKENRRCFLKKQGVDLSDAIFMDPEHGTAIVSADQRSKGELISCDAIVSLEANIPLVLTPADCLPIFFWNEECIGLIHAGRRGTVEKILLKTIINTLVYVSGKPLSLSFGACIRGCCYQFNPEYFLRECYKILPHIHLIDGNPLIGIDLVGANISQISDLDSISLAKKISFHRPVDKAIDCTCCSLDEKGNHRYFSHTRSTAKHRFPGKFPEGRNLAFIMRKK